MQLTDKIVGFFKEKGYLQAIETNGTKRIPESIDYITCSPKQTELVKELIPEVWMNSVFLFRKVIRFLIYRYWPKTERYLLSLNI